MRATGPLTVRPMVAGDIPKVCALKARRLRDTFTAFAATEAVEREITAVAGEGTMAAHLRDPATRMYVACQGTTNVGVAGVRIQADTAHLFSAYTLPGLGAGQALTATRLDYARSQGARRATSDAFVENALGNAHLTRHGFRPTGHVRQGRSIPAQIRDWERAL